MPKLDATHLPQRLAERLADLKAGKEVAARDIKALLNDEQVAAMDAAWEQQQILRKGKRARTKEEELELGWKSKREIHIAAYESALKEVADKEVEAWNKKIRDADVRQARTYFDTLGKELQHGKDLQTAKNKANNDLTRAGLRRLDGQLLGTQGLTKRDREIRAMEEAILQKAEGELDDYEREQLELLREHEKAVTENSKKRG